MEGTRGGCCPTQLSQDHAVVSKAVRRESLGIWWALLPTTTTAMVAGRRTRRARHVCCAVWTDVPMTLHLLVASRLPGSRLP